MPLYTLAPSPYLTVLDDDGNPVSLALIYTYLSGLSTPSPTYADSGGVALNDNPIEADSAGRYTAYLPAGISQKWVVKTAGGLAVIRTIDPVTAVPTSATNQDITGTAGESLAAGVVAYLSDGSGGKNA